MYKSIVIYNTYNSLSKKPSFEESIKSILNQRDVKYSVIAVDDGSEDGTLEYLTLLTESYANLIVVENEMHLGIGGSRNTGLKYAEEYDYVFFCDDDEHGTAL